jgi:adenylate kinase family enzyme
VERVLVLGSGGAGKTTLSAKLAAVTGLPLIHLDTLYWRPGWVRPPEEEWEAIVGELLTRERWIMDGNFAGTVARRAEITDTVVFLDVARVRCLIRALRRVVRPPDRVRPDLPDSYRERFDREFARWIWSYPKKFRPRILAVLDDVRHRGGTVVELHDDAEIESFLNNLPR